MLLKTLSILGALSLAVAGLVPNKQIQSTSGVTFSISNMKVNTVEGSFGGMTGTIKFDPAHLDSTVFDVCIDAATVNTANEARDKHLKNKDFFHVEKYPNICIKASAVSKTPVGYLLKGNLTMHGRTKPVEIPFSFKDNTFYGAVTVSRLKFGVGKDVGTFKVGDEVDVTITCKVQ